MQRDIFFDKKLQATFIEQGYVKFALQNPEILDQFIAEANLLKPDDDFKPFLDRTNTTVNFHISLYDNNKSYKQRACSLIEKYFLPELKKLLIDYKIIGSSIFIKNPACDEMEMHQHWTITDDIHTTLSCWIPLQDVDVHNGAMRLLTGSHKIMPYITSTSQNEYFAEIKPQLQQHFTTIPLKKGEAVIFCETLIHSSHQNNTALSRRAVQISVYPAECDLHVYFKNVKNGGFDKYAFDREFFLNMIDKRDVIIPDGRSPIGFIPDNNRNICYNEFLFRMQEGPKVRHNLYNRQPVEYRTLPSHLAKQANNSFTNKYSSLRTFLKKLIS